MSTNKKAYIVPHTHWDREWYFSTEESQVLLVFTMQQMLEQLENDDGLPCFVLDGQSVMLEDYLSVVPEDTDRVKALVESGKLLVGPWYTQTDQCVVHGESQIRNLLWGCRDAERFGGVMKVGYVPDSFGQSEQLPQLLQHFNIDKCVFWRGIWEGICANTEFVWRAPDGSNVTTAVLEFGYSAFQGMKAMDTHLDGIDQKMTERFWPGERENFLFMGGHDQKPWQTETVEAINQANETRPYQYQLCSFEDYFASTATGTLPVIESEMLYGKYSRIHRGIYSTRYDIKKLNSDVENLLINQLEPLLTVANQFGLKYPYGLMEKNWKQLMQSHAHDSIGGCNTDSVNSQVKARIQAVRENAERLKEITLKQLADSSTKGKDGEYVLVFNPLPYSRNVQLELELVLPTRQFTVYDGEQRVATQSIDCELVDINAIVQDPTTLGDERFRSWYRHTVLVSLEGLPACGYRNLKIERLADAEEAGPEKAEAESQAEKEESVTIANDALSVSVDMHGTVSLSCLVSGQYWHDLLTLVDGGDDGDNYDFSEPHADYHVGFNTEAENIRVCHGPLRSEVRITYHATLPADLSERAEQRCSVKQSLDVVLGLAKGSEQLDIAIEIDNHVNDHRLQLHVNGDFARAQSIADQPIGLIQRGNDESALSLWQQQQWTSCPMPIYPMQSVVAGETLQGGLAVMTDGIREYQQYDDSIAITLFRAMGFVGKPDLKYRPGRLSGLPDASPDSQLQQSLSFRLALYPFSGSAYDAGLCQRVKEWLSKPLTLHNGVVQRFMIAPPMFTAPEAYSLLALNQPSVTVSAVKICEDDTQSVIVRLMNVGTEAVALGELPAGWKVQQVDGMERIVGDITAESVVPAHGMLGLRLRK
ncbi:glycoside hydrolase family 38 C-terminal domain-containing protein [Photobacterium lutimaris]|uniref:Sugar hydrolase n=1 Tax=Photobacterium lutimaris TaxID=388278 RepID=A0A2T3J503_9GAMM|nr:glycoside hydrolase family 38 C-terminal domain-containing protein [Photobacterium lutimaris]PSU36369.1 sugar hydrolase [Photobacterium lutimaris]TDR74732.1 mannosylglycerate hydrolase [Photobacterium lutimaris]